MGTFKFVDFKSIKQSENFAKKEQLFTKYQTQANMLEKDGHEK